MKTGYLMVDDRVSGGTLREADVATCSHCQAQVVLNPLRTRERTVCFKCAKYVCDSCAGALHATFECIPLNARFDNIQERLFRAQNIGEI